MSAPSDISISGSFHALLHNGVRPRDCITELVDDAVDAKSTIVSIHILSEKNEIVIADNGHGMDKPGLKEAYTLNKTTRADNCKQGKFGNGLNSAMAILTQLEFNPVTISKTEHEELPSQIVMDVAEIKTNRYNNFATEVTRANEPKFNRYVTDAFNTESGTVHMIQCDAKLFVDIRDAMLSNDIKTSLQYVLGIKYNFYLKNGGQLRITVDDTSFTIFPIDPLEIDNISEDNFHKKTTIIERYTDIETGENALNIPGRGWYMMAKKRTDKSKKVIFNNTPLPTSFVKTSEFKHESTYSDDWIAKQQVLFGETRFASITRTTLKQKVISDQETTKLMGGRYWNRGTGSMNMTIDRMDITASSGDTAGYQFVNNSRHRTTFPVEMDEDFRVQVNKSKIQYELIHPDIIRICEMLEKEFTNRLYAEYKAQLPQPEVVTKQRALEMLERITGHFEEHRDQVLAYVDKMIDVIVNIGKSKQKPDDVNQQKIQWRIVADTQTGSDTIIDVMTATIQYQKDGVNIVGGEALKALFEIINA